MLADSEQMHRKADDIGPWAELDHLTYLCDLYIWPTYLTYLLDLLSRCLLRVNRCVGKQTTSVYWQSSTTWPNYMTYIFDLHIWHNYLTYLFRCLRRVNRCVGKLTISAHGRSLTIWPIYVTFISDLFIYLFIYFFFGNGGEVPSFIWPICFWPI